MLRAPFKFLAPYGPEDRDIFFGRDLEIDEISARFYRSRTLVVHGESGSGKTSLVQCGLRAKIPSYDALFITVRAVLDPLEALRRELLRELQLDDAAAPETALECLERLAVATRKTVVVVFDQFEEFFLFQPHSVRERFIREFAAWNVAEVNARFIFCIREEYLARLTEFEAATPDIFWNRLWVRRMSGDQARQAITGPCGACGITAALELVDELLADLTRGGKGVELPILQVVLDSLYHTELHKKKAASATEDKAAALVLSLEAYKAQGKIEAILARFVETAVASHPAPDAARQVLKSLVTSEGTKKVSALCEIEEAVLQFGEPITTTELETLLLDLINARVLREDAENHLFELRHDALAATIHDWMTGLEKELMEAREALRARYRHHEALRKSGGALLDLAFLDYLAPYEPRLKLSGELADYVAASKEEAKKRLRRRRLALGVLVALAFVVLAGVTMWNVRERQRATASEQKAVIQEELARDQEKLAKVNEQTARGSLAEIYANEGHKAREQHEWGKALLLYRASLEQLDNLAARFGAAATMPKFAPESAAIRGLVEAVVSVAFSPDGRVLASASNVGVDFSGSKDKTIRLWDSASGKKLLVLKGHTDGVRSIVFSPNGRLLASGAEDKTIRLWDTASGKMRAVLRGHEKGVISVAFSPDGRMLASGATDNTIRLWDPTNGKELAVLRGHENRILSVAFSPDGRVLASGSEDETIRLWDTATGKELVVLIGHQLWVNSVAFSPDGRFLASGAFDKTIRLWDPTNGKELAVLKGHEGAVFSVAFSPDGSMLASGAADKTIRLWEPASGKELAVIRGHERMVESVTFSPDGRVLASGARDKTIRLWNLARSKELDMIKGLGGWVNALAFNPEGSMLASGGQDKTIYLWDPSSGKELMTFKGHAQEILSVTFSPDGRVLASGAKDKTIRLWDKASGKELAVLKGHEDGIESIVFSPDSRILASGSSDKTIRLWDTGSGKELAVFKGHGSRIQSVVFSPDGRMLASGSSDGTIRLWDTVSGKELAMLGGHELDITSVTFSPDGRVLAAGEYDGTIRLWDPTSGKELAVLRGHEGIVRAIAFSPDGRVLASGANDQTVRLWDAASWKELAVLRGHEESVFSIAFSPDGHKLVSGGMDKTIRFWDLGSSDLQKLFIRLRTYTDTGISFDLDHNGKIQFKDPVDLSRRRLEAACAGRMFWREDGGKSLTPLFASEIEKSKSSTKIEKATNVPEADCL